MSFQSAIVGAPSAGTFAYSIAPADPADPADAVGAGCNADARGALKRADATPASAEMPSTAATTPARTSPRGRRRGVDSLAVDGESDSAVRRGPVNRTG